MHVAAIRSPMCYLKDTELVAICAVPAVRISGSPHLQLLPNSSPLAAEAVKGKPLAVIQMVWGSGLVLNMSQHV